MENPTPEEQAALQARLSDFVKEYGELVAKHNVDFATYPVFVPDGKGGFRVTVQNTPVDITKSEVQEPQKSPEEFIPQA